MSVGVVMNVIWIASSIDTSTISARSGARRAPPRGRGAERGVHAGHELAEPAADRERRTVRVTVAREAPAARLQHLVGELEAVVGPAVADRA